MDMHAAYREVGPEPELVTIDDLLAVAGDNRISPPSDEGNNHRFVDRRTRRFAKPATWLLRSGATLARRAPGGRTGVASRSQPEGVVRPMVCPYNDHRPNHAPAGPAPCPWREVAPVPQGPITF